MNEEPKKAAFDWELGNEIVSLHVGSYAYGDRLYIGMVSYGEDGPEPFADMTVNIPIDNLKEKLYFGTATRADITRITRRLGDDIAKVYGFSIPRQRQEQAAER